MTACSLRDILVSRPRATSRRTTSARARSPTRTSTPCSCTATRASPASRRRSAPRRSLACRSTTRASSSRGRRAAAPRAARRVVVSAGGGLVGEPLLRAAIEAQRAMRRPALPMRADRRAVLPDDAWSALRAAAAARAGSSSCARCPTSPRELRSAAASVSQCGYNTALEIVRARSAGARRAVRDARRRTSSAGARARLERARRPAGARARPARRRARSRARSRRLLDVRAGAGRRSTSTARARHLPRAAAATTASCATERVACMSPRRPHAAAVRRAPVEGARRRRRRDRRADGRRPREAVAARARRRPAARPRTAPFELDGHDWRLLAGVAALVLVIALAEAGAAVPLRPLAAERRRADHARAAGRRLRPPAAALARLPPAAPEGRPGHARHRRRQRDRRPVLAVARRGRAGGAAGGRDGRRAVRARPGARRWSRSRPRRCWPAISYVYRRRVKRAGARAPRARGPDRLARQRGAVGDGRRQGVRLRAASRPTACARAARSGWRPASRSRGCRRASTASSAPCARSAPPPCSSSASCASRPARSRPAS